MSGFERMKKMKLGTVLKAKSEEPRADLRRLRSGFIKESLTRH
jgi:hypothetical protein